MSKQTKQEHQLLYFTTPFCGVCQSAQPLIEMLALSLEVPFVVQNLHTFTNDYEHLQISKTPAVVLVRDKKIIYYTENINNLTDLFQRFNFALNQE